LADRTISIADLDDDERALVAELHEKASEVNDWNAFDNHRNARIRKSYERRGITPSQWVRTAVYRIGQDLSGGIAVAAGSARAPDDRDELEETIAKRFKSQKAFCDATGLSPDMVSHVLARRRPIAIDTLNSASARVGYRLRIVEQAK
jgi:hypothetical protein